MGQLPVIAALFGIPLIVWGISVSIRVKNDQPYTSGLDILVAKLAIDFSLVVPFLLPDPWKSILSPMFRPIAPLWFFVLGLVAILLFAKLLPLEDQLLRHWMGRHFPDSGGSGTIRVRFPRGRYFLTWFVIVSYVAINLIVFRRMNIRDVILP